MTLNKRERMLVIIAIPAVACILAYRFWPSTTDSDSTVFASSDAVATAEKRLMKLRQVASVVPAKEQTLKTVQDELAVREKNVLKAATAQQAQAELLQTLRRVMNEQQPPIQPTSSEIGQVRPLGDHYGEAQVSVTFVCRIEDLVNFLTDLTKEKELITTTEIRLGTASPKEKTIPVRLTVAGVVRRDLVPDKKVLNF